MLAVLSLSWFFIAGLGALPVLALARRGSSPEPADLRLLAVIWSYGLCLDYLLLLLLRSLVAILIVGSLLALAGGASALWLWRRRLLRPRYPRCWIAGLVLLVAAVLVIVIDPLDDWDARSIWFFHAKAIFFAGGLWRDTGLLIHADYPLLLPGLAAQVSEVVGFWNEYLPKFALVLLLPVPILAVLGLAETPGAMALAAVGFLAVGERYLGNGSMDAYLALYAAAGALYLADWLEGGSVVALLAAAGALGVVGGLKQEAEVVYLALALSATILLASRRIALPRTPRWTIPLALLPFGGFLLWQLLLHLWSLQEAGFSFASAWRRITDPHQFWRILHSVMFDTQVRIMLLLLILVSAGLRAQGRWFPRSSMPALLAGLLYIAGFCAIFAMTDADLRWHLATAADRVVRSGALLLLIAAVVALRSQERALLLVHTPGKLPPEPGPP